MEKNFNAGYFLIKLKPIYFGSDLNKTVETCSSCINFSVFDYWCLSWTNDKLDNIKKADLNLTDEKIIEIQKWTDEKFNNEEIKWGNALPNLETAMTFKNHFFNGLNDINIYSIYFNETDTDGFLTEFDDDGTNNGNFALRFNLLNRIEERDDKNEICLGYDFIGVEGDGSFHSFYCHDIKNTLIDKFFLKLNSYGLFEKPEKLQEIKDYLNDQETGLEPVPWYIVKVKRHDNASC